MKWEVMGQQLTLNHIEHEIVRKEFKEPRIHMALVCAAMGCPRLRKDAYTGKKLKTQLNDDARRFLKLPFQLRIDQVADEVFISTIFKWFGDDFIRKYETTSEFMDFNETERAVLRFITIYADKDSAQYLKSNKFDIEYTDYDWTLNEQN